MIYNTNEDIRVLLKHAAGEEGVTLTEIARRCGILPQRINDIMLKKHIAFDDVKPLAEAIGMDLYIALVPKRPDGNQ